MTMTFQRATKAASKLRMAVAGPSGSGKTFTALKLATYIAQAVGGRAAAIDTERGSMSKYADLFDFDVLELGQDPRDPTPFHPDRYIQAIAVAVQHGYAALVIDSLSHAWFGKGGLLEMVDAIAKRSKSGNSFQAWGDVTPVHNAFVDAILSAPLHIIATMRSKTKYVIETNDRGRSVPRKVGLEPVQRDNLEYEFDLAGEMDMENTLLIQKSRCSQLAGQVIQKPDERVAQTLLVWLEAGRPPVQPVHQTPVPRPAEVPAPQPAAATVPAQPPPQPAPQPAAAAQPPAPQQPPPAQPPAPQQPAEVPAPQKPSLHGQRVTALWAASLNEGYWTRESIGEFLKSLGAPGLRQVTPEHADAWESELQNRRSQAAAQPQLESQQATQPPVQPAPVTATQPTAAPQSAPVDVRGF